MLKYALPFVALVFLGCANSPPRDVSSLFADAKRAYDSQSITPDVVAYNSAWIRFNNSKKLDERYGCYAKENGQLQQILKIDETGAVVDYFSDRDNKRARCFRSSYIGVKFPAPPFAPYYRYMVMM